MSKAVPKHIALQYENGARGFRAEKRRQFRELEKCYTNLRVGCAYYPCGSAPFDDINTALDEIEKALSREVWGQ